MAGDRHYQTAGWKRLREQIIARDGGACTRCGATRLLEVDHVLPRVQGGDDDPDNLRTLCRACHKARKHNNLGRGFSGAPSSAPLLAHSHSGGTRRRPKVNGDGLTLPRLVTKPRRPAGTYGPEMVAAAREHMGVELLPWQAYAADRMLEHDDDGRLMWRTVVLTIARGQGKSWFIQAAALWRLLQAERFGEPQEVTSVAQTAQVARMPWERAARALMDAGTAKHALWGRGFETVTMPDESTWRVLAARLSATTGYRSSFITVDEAWSVPSEVVEQGLRPQMRRRKQTQMLVVSTAGDGRSDLLVKLREQAMGGKGRTLLLEWSAPPDAKPDSVQTWRWANPDWDDDTAADLREYWQTTPEPVFRSQCLNQWVGNVAGWISQTVWNACRDTRAKPSPEGFAAIDCAPDGTAWYGVRASPDGDGATVVRCIRADKPDDVWRWAMNLPAGVQVVVGESIDGLQPAGLRRDGTFTSRALRQWIPGVQQMIRDGQIKHDGDQLLAEHVLRAETAVIQSGTVFKLSNTPIVLCRLLVVAAGMTARRPAQPVIIAS